MGLWGPIDADHHDLGSGNETAVHAAVPVINFKCVNKEVPGIGLFVLFQSCYEEVSACLCINNSNSYRVSGPLQCARK